MIPAGPSPDRLGLFAHLRQLLQTSLAILHNRLALLANDVELGTLRVFDAVVLALLGIAGVVLGLGLLCGWLLLLVDPGHRVWVAGLLTAVFLGGGIGALWAGRRRLVQAGAAFESTRAELARDLAALRGSD
jgi:uncharacterized membrane protein YqjE